MKDGSPFAKDRHHFWGGCLLNQSRNRIERAGLERSAALVAVGWSLAIGVPWLKFLNSHKGIATIWQATPTAGRTSYYFEISTKCSLDDPAGAARILRVLHVAAKKMEISQSTQACEFGYVALRGYGC